MVDASTDPQPLDDSRAIQLRDEALDVKDVQIAQLSEQNLELLQSLELVENEVQRMQKDLSERDTEVQKKKAETKEYKKEVIRLRNVIKSAKGQQYAMDIAAKQNTQLLQLLEASEKVQTDAELDKAQAEANADDMRSKMMEAVRDAAVHEASAIVDARDARVYQRQVARLQVKLDQATFNLSKQLRETKVEARTQIDAVQGELQMRREKQYELLDKLGKAEERLRAEADR